MKKLKAKILFISLLQNSTIPSFYRVLFYFFTFCVFLLTLPGCPTEPGDGNKNTPPDTTSQNFTFETYEFGDGFSSSYFNDVWIFDENNIIAVGFLSSKDTIIVGQHVYNTNIIKWNGSEWKILPYTGTSDGIYGIWAKDSSNIYYANGLVFKYEEGKYITYDFTSLPFSQNQSVHKLWGSSENNIYGVGPNGTIVYFDGNTWTKIDFDIQWYFYEITGNKETGTAYAVARRELGISSLIKINNIKAEIIYEDTSIGFTSSVFNSVDEVEKDILCISGYNIWSFNISNNMLEQLDSLSGYFLASVSIYNINDRYFFGGNGNGKSIMIHYNGKRFNEFELGNSDEITFWGSDSIEDLAVVVGERNNKSYLTIVRRR